MFPQFDPWCQFSSVIACDPQCEEAGDKASASVPLCWCALSPWTSQTPRCKNNASYLEKKKNIQKLCVAMHGLAIMNSEASNVHIYKECNILHWSITSK